MFVVFGFLASTSTYCNDTRKYLVTYVVSCDASCINGFDSLIVTHVSTVERLLQINWNNNGLNY